MRSISEVEETRSAKMLRVGTETSSMRISSQLLLTRAHGLVLGPCQKVAQNYKPRSTLCKADLLKRVLQAKAEAAVLESDQAAQEIATYSCGEVRALKLLHGLEDRQKKPSELVSHTEFP